MLWQSEGTTEAEPGSGHPCWAGTGGTGLAVGETAQVRLWVSPSRLGPPTQGGGKPPHHLPSPRATARHWWGAETRGLALEVPAGLVGGNRGRGARAGKLPGSKLAGHPQTAPNWGPQPFAGSGRGQKQLPTVPRGCGKHYRCHPTGSTAKGAGASPALGGGDAAGDGESGSPDPWPWVSSPLGSRPPLLPHPASPTAWGSGV